MVHHKIHDAELDRAAAAARPGPAAALLSPLSTAATLNLAAVAAQGARVWKTIDPAFSARGLTAAREGVHGGQGQPEPARPDPNDGTGGGSYVDNNGDRRVLLGRRRAVRHHRQAGLPHRPDRLVALYGRSFNQRGSDWSVDGRTGRHHPGAGAQRPAHRRHRPASRAAFTVSAADRLLERDARSGLPGAGRPPGGGYFWGSNGLIANNANVLALAYDFTGSRAVPHRRLRDHGLPARPQPD